MDTRCVSCTAENPAIPADLADGLGTGRLTHLALESVQGLEVPWTEFRLGPGYPGHSFRVLLTLLTYAYGRGVLASDEVLDRVGSDADFRYICSTEYPDAATLRAFRRREGSRLQTTLTQLVRSAMSLESGNIGINAQAEASRRLEAAAAADSLALDY